MIDLKLVQKQPEVLAKVLAARMFGDDKALGRNMFDDTNVQYATGGAAMLVNGALSRAMQQPDRKVSRFDATLKNKLQQFQREQGLTPDGIAGSNTLLRLNVVAGEPMPRLEDESLRASTPVDLDAVVDDAMDPLVEEAS